MILRKSRALKHQPEYLLIDAHTLYEQASDKFLEASDAFIEHARSRNERIQELTVLLSEEHQARGHALSQSEAALDMAEHLSKL